MNKNAQIEYQKCDTNCHIHLHVSKTMIAYEKKFKPVLKNHIMSEDQACKSSDQLDQHIAFHKALIIKSEISTMSNKKFTIK